VGRARVTYYPIDGFLKNIRIGIELADGSRREFPLAELRRAGPEEEATLAYDREETEGGSATGLQVEHTA